MAEWRNWICWGLPLQLTQFIEIHRLPHLESFMWKRKFEIKFFKKDLISSPNVVLPICKLLFPNGSYCNEVCRALWACCIRDELAKTQDKVLFLDIISGISTWTNLKKSSSFELCLWLPASLFLRKKLGGHIIHSGKIYRTPYWIPLLLYAQILQSTHIKWNKVQSKYQILPQKTHEIFVC